MRILVARSGGLGDCLLTLPVFDAIAHSHPHAAITVLGNTAMCAVAALAGYEHFADIDDPRFASLYAPGDEEVSESLRDFLSVFDRVYLFTAFHKPNVLVRRITGAGVRYCRVSDPRPSVGSHEHIIARLIRILDEHECPDADMILPETVRPLLDYHRKGRGDGILIHPGSGGRDKIWPLDRFLELADRAAHLLHEKVSFVLGPAECERGMDSRLEEAGRPFVITPAIGELADQVATARLFIGNDSGAGHLAAMTGTPAVILYGPTDPRIWRPVGVRVRTVVSPDGTMTGIGVEDVEAVVRTFNLSA